MAEIAYYAVPDPDDPGRMVYLRRNARGHLDPWPAKARYGPVLYKRDVPAGLKGEDRQAWISEWIARNSRRWWAAVRQAVADDPDTAQARFAALCTRCCMCGRVLTDQASKAYGIGPECRAGWPDEWLATMAERVGRMHAALESTEVRPW